MFSLCAAAAPFMPRNFHLGGFAVLSLGCHAIGIRSFKKASSPQQLIWLITALCSAVVFVLLP